MTDNRYPYPVSPLLPGPIVEQGMAIQQRLQIAFPVSYFRFKILPAKLNAKKWADLMTGNQPFVGLGWNGIKAARDFAQQFVGDSIWLVLVAVRRQGSEEQRCFGDEKGIGVLTMANVATAMLQGAKLATGSASVSGVTNLAADDWGDDCALIGINVEIPIRLPLADNVNPPDGLGWFNEMASAWGWPAPDGTAGGYNSDWENPNAQT